MDCRPGCAACCIVISISSPLPGMPEGKPAGMVCLHLDPVTRRCGIWGQEIYPEVCGNFKADPEYCGERDEDAYRNLLGLEIQTRPRGGAGAE